MAPEALFLEVLPEWLTSGDVESKREIRSPAMRTRIWPEHGYVALRLRKERIIGAVEDFRLLSALMLT
ncbi:MAG: hypothetical protein ACUVRS_10235 [Armatimonadota bacterium]